MKLSSNSKLYKVFSAVGFVSRWTRTMTLCDIFWKTVLLAMLTLTILMILGVMIINPIITLYVWFTTGVFDPNSEGAKFLFTDCIILFGSLLAFTIYKTASFAADKLDEEPGMIRRAYQDWKEKTCTIVEIVHED